MQTKTFYASCMKQEETVALGRQMEDNYRAITFDLSGFGLEIDRAMIVHQRKADTAPYVVTSVTGGNSITWTVTNTDTAYSGRGQAEIRIEFTNGLAKSVVFQTVVIRSITADTTIPEPLQSWYDAMIDYIDDHSVSPEQIEQAVADYLDEHPVQAPVTSVNSKIGAVVLNADDVGALPDTTTAADLGAYEKPNTGIPKTDLASDVQASLNRADTALQSAPVTSVNGQTGAVSLNASDVGALPSTYTAPVQSVDGKTGAVQIMPSGGTAGQVLTKTASGTAWQTPSAGGSVDSVNGQTGTVVLDADDVGALPDTTTAADLGAYVKPSGGIPKTDLASDVQTSLGKADTALQTAPVTSVNGQTGAVTLSIPTKTSDLTNDSGYITSAPVQSVDGKTGAVAVLPTGGASGQVLAKSSATDYAVEWVNQSGGGGGSVDWQLLYDGTTTEEANLHIAVTNISVSEFIVYVITYPTSGVIVYISPNQTDGTHNSSGYGRAAIGTGTTTGAAKYAWCRVYHMIGNLVSFTVSDGFAYAGQSDDRQQIGTDSRSMTIDQKYTAISIGTYQAVSANTRVIVLGR